MIAATAFTPVPVNLGVNTDSGARRWVELPGEATAVPQLFITPRVGFLPDHEGAIGYGSGYMLVHSPTGYPLLRGLGTGELRELAEKLTVIDWDWSDIDAFKASGDFKQAGLIIRDHQLTQPSSAEHPAYDSWGDNGKGTVKGKGLKRAAVPMALDVLADLQRCHNRLFGDGEDRLHPDAPDGKGGTQPSPEWSFAVIQKVQDFGLAYLLLALHTIDPKVADSAAAMLADLWESGDSIGEWGWEWHERLLKGEPLDLPGVPTVELTAPA